MIMAFPFLLALSAPPGCHAIQNEMILARDVAAVVPDLSIRCDESSSCYRWKIGIVSTVFWIGETGSGPTNERSAWDKNWVSSYGGLDDPVHRSGYGPAGFRPFQNPLSI